MCERIFQAEGVAASISTGDFPLDFIPFDNDLLSLELQDSLKVVVPSRQAQVSPSLLKPPLFPFGEHTVLCCPALGDSNFALELEIV